MIPIGVRFECNNGICQAHFKKSCMRQKQPVQRGKQHESNWCSHSDALRMWETASHIGKQKDQMWVSKMCRARDPYRFMHESNCSLRVHQWIAHQWKLVHSE